LLLIGTPYPLFYQGQLLWDVLRDWELNNLSTMLPDEGWALTFVVFLHSHSNESLYQIGSHHGD
jgi:hypothetical protein